MREIELIREKTTSLIEAIRSSSVYIEYHSALEDIQKHPELKELADSYRIDRYRAFHAESPTGFEIFDDLEEKRDELAEYPQIDRFLKAELALCRVLQEVGSSVTGAMCFD